MLDFVLKQNCAFNNFIRYLSNTFYYFLEDDKKLKALFLYVNQNENIKE